MKIDFKNKMITYLLIFLVGLSIVIGRECYNSTLDAMLFLKTIGSLSILLGIIHSIYRFRKRQKLLKHIKWMDNMDDLIASSIIKGIVIFLVLLISNYATSYFSVSVFKNGRVAEMAYLGGLKKRNKEPVITVEMDNKVQNFYPTNQEFIFLMKDKDVKIKFKKSVLGFYIAHSFQRND